MGENAIDAWAGNFDSNGATFVPTFVTMSPSKCAKVNKLIVLAFCWGPIFLLGLSRSHYDEKKKLNFIGRINN